MRYLLLGLLVALCAWYWRRSRLGGTTPEKPAPTPQTMEVCRLCGVHIPREDAVVGALGRYCSLTHRANAEP